MLWGMTGFEDAETDRPMFKGKSTTSPVDGSPFKYESPARGRRNHTISQVYIILYIF